MLGAGVQLRARQDERRFHHQELIRTATHASPPLLPPPNQPELRNGIRGLFPDRGKRETNCECSTKRLSIEQILRKAVA